MIKNLLNRIFIFGTNRPFNAVGSSTVEKLKAGNDHFISYTLMKSPVVNLEKVRHLAVYGQNPKAVIVTCSDARISPERIFYAEMGDFFIIRTAGNVVGELELGSIEYAVSEFGVDTIIVMGHEGCGAIKSAVSPHEGDLGNIKSILDEIAPSVEKAAAETKNKVEFIVKAENYNIFNTLEKIKNSKVIKSAEEQGKLTVVAAKYGIADGKVTFFENN